MPLYRTLNLSDNKVQYVAALNKAQGRSHVARKIIQIDVATPEQILADVDAGVDVKAVEARPE